MAKYKPQEESRLQKQIMEYLNNKQDLDCTVYRMRNPATYDPTNHCFRRGSSIKGIPDIMGYASDGRIIAIEVKIFDPSTKNVKKPSREQKDFLQRAGKKSPYVGIAYSIEDAEAIIRNDKEKFPRNLRTYNYLERGDRKAYEDTEGKRKETYKPSKPNCGWINWVDENKRKA